MGKPASCPPADLAMMTRTLQTLPRQPYPVEIRAIGGGDVQVRRFSCFDIEAAANEAARLSTDADGTYLVMNVPRGDLLKNPPKAGTGARDIDHRQWFLVDCDPKRPADVSSTDEEKAAALAVALAVREYLCSLGWPKPILADSGNGWHLLYFICLDNDDASTAIVKACLRALADRFDTAAVTIDQKVCDAPRLVKFYGTPVKKGVPTKERPHRLSAIVEGPYVRDAPAPGRGGLELVFDELLADLAASAKTKTTKGRRATVAPDKPRPASEASNGQDAYALAALHAEVEILAATPEGDRNDQLNTSAFSLGQLVGAKALDRGDVEQALAIEARRIGLGDLETEKTIKSGLDAGVARPRDLSDVGRKPSSNGRATADGKPPPGKPDIGVAEPRTFGNTGDDRSPIGIGQIEVRLREVAGPWPKRVDNLLFCESSDLEPVYLDSPARLFAWIDRRTAVEWSKGSRFITQERFYEHLRMESENYRAIETLPHWPPIVNVYYMHGPVRLGDGAKLERLLDFFNPLNPEDRELIRAFILTPFWGGQPGTRPAFLITGPDQDEQQGRGVGKTKLLDLLAGLFGGRIDVSHHDPIGDIKTRLLSDAARQVRLARLDNVKTLKFSWGDLENLITADVISGKMLYRGEGQRPNTVVWGITLNGATLSKDMAQRVVVIKLGRPKFKASWEDDVRKFIRDNHAELLGDIRGFLEGPSRTIDPATRWSLWERDILGRVAMPQQCQRIIVDRQGSVDDDADEAGTVADFFAEKLALHGHKSAEEAVFIPNQVAASWVNEATNQKLQTNRTSALLKGLGIPELRKSADDGNRGWVWRGKKSNPSAPAAPLGLAPSC